MNEYYWCKNMILFKFKNSIKQTFRNTKCFSLLFIYNNNI